MDFPNPRDRQADIPEDRFPREDKFASERPERVDKPRTQGGFEERGSSPAAPRIQTSVIGGALNSYSDRVTQPQASTRQPEEDPSDGQVLPIWMQRTMLVIYVLFCVEIGLVLAVLPWTRAWTENAMISSFPWLKNLASYNFTRGIVTGIGLLDLWLGIWEAVHYKDHRPQAGTRAAG